jgi:rRNA maturation protein Nop10
MRNKFTSIQKPICEYFLDAWFTNANQWETTQMSFNEWRINKTKAHDMMEKYWTIKNELSRDSFWMFSVSNTGKKKHCMYQEQISGFQGLVGAWCDSKGQHKVSFAMIKPLFMIPFKHYIETCRRYNLWEKPPRRGKTLTPPHPPAHPKHPFSTLNRETRKAPVLPDASSYLLERHRPPGELSGTQYSHKQHWARSA